MRPLVIALFSTAALLIPGIAYAQDTAPAKEEGGLDEIVVTAQKRTESLSDVPISISAVSGERLDNYGQTKLDDIASSVPNVRITQTGIGNRIAIRGVASNDNKGFEQSVSLFLDGVYFGRDQLSRLPIIDVERVEVLRGPQPTLFGKNAIAGAVSITTRKASDELEGEVRAMHEFNHNEYQLTGILSAPLNENLGVRLVANYRTMDGYFTNTNLKRKEPQIDDLYLRGRIDYDNSSNFTAGLKIDYATFKAKGQPRESYGPVGNYSAVFVGPLAVETNLDYRRSDNGYSSDNDVRAGMFDANYEFENGIKLTGITSLLGYDTFEIIDIDYTSLSFLDGTSLDESYDQFSQEIRFTSPGGEKFDWIGGVYYQDSELKIKDNVVFNPFFLGFGPPFNALGDTSTPRDYSQTSKLYSAFAQGEYKLTDRLSWTIGARFNHERKFGSRQLEVVQGGLSVAPAATVQAVFRALNIEEHSVADRFSENSFNPMTNIQYEVSPDVKLYASFARGSKAGGFDVRSNSAPTSTTVRRPGSFRFGSEQADSLEAGLKFNNRVVAFNISAYRTIYKDLQVNIFDGVLNFNVKNAAGAKTQGVETDVRVALGRGLTFGAALAYLDFTFTDFDQGQCYFGQVAQPNGLCDYTGQPNALAPQWTGNANLNYETGLSSTLELAANLNVDFSSDYFAAPNLDPLTRQSAYAKLGARIALSDIDKNWEIALIGRNLTNQRIMQNAGPLPLATTFTRGGGNAYTGIFERPRSIAIQLSGRF